MSTHLSRIEGPARGCACPSLSRFKFGRTPMLLDTEISCRGNVRVEDEPFFCYFDEETFQVALGLEQDCHDEVLGHCVERFGLRSDFSLSKAGEHVFTRER